MTVRERPAGPRVAVMGGRIVVFVVYEAVGRPRVQRHAERAARICDRQARDSSRDVGDEQEAAA